MLSFYMYIPNDFSAIGDVNITYWLQSYMQTPIGELRLQTRISVTFLYNFYA